MKQSASEKVEIASGLVSICYATLRQAQGSARPTALAMTIHLFHNKLDQGEFPGLDLDPALLPDTFPEKGDTVTAGQEVAE